MFVTTHLKKLFLMQQTTPQLITSFSFIWCWWLLYGNMQHHLSLLNKINFCSAFYIYIVICITIILNVNSVIHVHDFRNKKRSSIFRWNTVGCTACVTVSQCIDVWSTKPESGSCQVHLHRYNNLWKTKCVKEKQIWNYYRSFSKL